MTKRTDAWGKAGVFNPHNYAGEGNVYLKYKGYGGRGDFGTVGWYVRRPGFKTDVGAHWTDYGSKTFSVNAHRGTHAENKATALNEAMAWAGERYGITKWARTPYGTWMDFEFVKARNAELDAVVKAKKKGEA